MKLKLEEMRDIAKTLPIGFYLGRKVPVIIEPSGGAYADTVKAEIHIGLPLLQAAADGIDAKDAATWNREKLLRCLLYHEVGHLLLTPSLIKRWAWVKDAQGRYLANSPNLINIFEDERLETILSQFFLGVDFRGFCRLVNKQAANAPKTDEARFFDAVRLRDTTKEISDAVDVAVARTSAYNTTYGSHHDYAPYSTVLSELYNKIVAASKEQEGGKSEGGGSNGKSKGESKSGKSAQESGGESGEDKQEGENPSGESQDGGKPEQKPKEPKPDGDGKGKPERDGDGEGGDDGDESESDAGGDAEGESESDGEGGSDGESEEDSAESKSRKRGRNGGDGSGRSEEEGEESESEDGEFVAAKIEGIPENLFEKLASKIFVTPTPEVSKTLERFANRLSKKKGAQAAGRWSALHGKIDARRDAQDKERIFRRSSDVGEALMSAVNLVLWIDVSGSFCRSEPILNRILAATARTMGMTGGKLEVEVVKMQGWAEVARPNEWRIVADGGNDINYTYYSCWRKTRKKNRRNIDIVVFDGQARSACHTNFAPDGRTPIEKAIWDGPDCHLVVDEANEFWAATLTKAHVTLMSGGYAEQLEAKVLEILDRIL